MLPRPLGEIRDHLIKDHRRIHIINRIAPHAIVSSILAAALPHAAFILAKFLVPANPRRKSPRRSQLQAGVLFGHRHPLASVRRRRQRYLTMSPEVERGDCVSHDGGGNRGNRRRFVSEKPRERARGIPSKMRNRGENSNSQEV